MDVDKFTEHFPNKLVISPTIDAKMWRLEEEFKYISTEEYGGEIILIKEGFLTDFASVPIGLRSIIPKWGRYGRAAVIHDWLYYEGDSYSRNWNNQGKTVLSQKEFADLILKDAMQVSGVNCFVREIIYQAVNWFGIFAWLSNKAKRAQKLEKMEKSKETITYRYSTNWSKSIKEQVPDMWKEWRKSKKKGD